MPSEQGKWDELMQASRLTEEEGVEEGRPEKGGEAPLSPFYEPG